MPNAIATWGYVVMQGNNVTEAGTGRVIGIQDSNRAELTAFIKALQYVRNQKGKMYVIYIDYEALFLYCNGKARPKKNLDLYKQINYLLEICKSRVRVEKVKAHKPNTAMSNFMNDVADNLAKKSIALLGAKNSY